jgi:hypothetical protein
MGLHHGPLPEGWAVDLQAGGEEQSSPNRPHQPRCPPQIALPMLNRPSIYIGDCQEASLLRSCVHIVKVCDP